MVVMRSPRVDCSVGQNQRAAQVIFVVFSRRYDYNHSTNCTATDSDPLGNYTAHSLWITLDQYTTISINSATDQVSAGKVLRRAARIRFIRTLCTSLLHDLNI